MSLSGNSTRAAKTRSVNSSPKPRRKPTKAITAPVPLVTLKEIKNRLTTVRSVVSSCARALETYPGTEDIQITLHNDVVVHLDCLAFVAKHILMGKPFPFPWRKKP